MNKEYFETPAYIQYLHEHCSPCNAPDTAHGRVAGMGLVRKMIDMLDLRRGMRVLEVGCGLGRLMNLLESDYGVETWGCDISDAVIREARSVLPDFRNRFDACTDTALPAPTSTFDAVVFWGVFEMTRQVPMLLESARVLKVGGRALLCSVKNVDFVADDADSKAALKAYVERAFPITYTRIEPFERAARHLGFQVEHRAVFRMKAHMVEERFEMVDGAHLEGACSDIVYILRKSSATPLDATVQFAPGSL